MNLQFTSADEAASYLHSSSDVTHNDIVGALINALQRIDALEKQVADLEIRVLVLVAAEGFQRVADPPDVRPIQ